jgi:hypothetical protein
MKLVSQIIFAGLITIAFACGGESKEKEKADSKSEETAENSGEEQKLCFVSEEQLTKAYANFILKGNTVSGTFRYETPKAGMTLFELSNVKGTKDGDKLTLTFSIVDNDEGKGIGESREEIWFMKGDELSPKEENVAGNLKKTACAENAEFKAETPKNEAEAPQSYEFDGVMDGKVKIKMFLTEKPNPEDKKEKIVEGYYYYLSQGKDKKIDLKGSTDVMLVSRINEVVGEKTFGRFTGSINNGDFVWTSADGKKEMKVVVTPSK